MPRPRREADAALQAIYDQIPPIPDCQGKCWISCSVIEMTGRESQRIREAGVRISEPDQAQKQEEYWCEALGPDGRCAIYSLRPLMCRLWGVLASLPCPYGCRPEGGWMSDKVASRLIAATWEAGGGKVRPDARLEQDAGVLGVPEAAERHVQRGLAGDMRRAVVHTELPEVVRRRRPLRIRLAPRRTVPGPED